MNIEISIDHIPDKAAWRLRVAKLSDGGDIYFYNADIPYEDEDLLQKLMADLIRLKITPPLTKKRKFLGWW